MILLYFVSLQISTGALQVAKQVALQVSANSSTGAPQVSAGTEAIKRVEDKGSVRLSTDNNQGRFISVDKGI